MKIKINYNNNNLYCVYSKEIIEIGHKYVEIVETEGDDEIIRVYKLDYAPTADDNEEPYIGE